MRDIFVVEFICKGAGDEIGGEFEAELNYRVVFEAVGSESLNGVDEGLVGEFDNLVLRMDTGHLEYLILQNIQGVVQVNLYSVLVGSLDDGERAEVVVDCGWLIYLLVYH